MNKVQLRLDGHEVTAFVGTGADYSVVSKMMVGRPGKVANKWDGRELKPSGFTAREVHRLLTTCPRCHFRDGLPFRKEEKKRQVTILLGVADAEQRHEAGRLPTATHRRHAG